MVGKAVAISSIVALALLGAGTFFIVNSLAPLERENIALNDTFNVLGDTYENKTAWLKNDVDYRISFTVTDGTIKFCPMDEGQLSIWQQGQFEPRWVESDQYYMGIGGTGDPAGGVTYYFVFFNNDTATKEVHLEVSNRWQETNYIGLLGGAALLLSGGITVIIAKYRLTRV